LVTVPAPDMARFCDWRPAVGGLISGGPQRGSKTHRKALSVAVLPAPGFAGDLVLFRQSRVENPAKLHITGMAARRDDDALPGPDVHVGVSKSCADSQDSSCRRSFPDDRRQLVPQEKLDAFCSRTRL